MGVSASKAKLERYGCCRIAKTTCSTCGNKHHVKCLSNTEGFFGCGIDGHKMRDSPTITARGRKAKKVPTYDPGEDVGKL